VNWVDATIAILVVLAIIRGWSTGAVVQLTSMTGFCGGLVVGAFAAVPIAHLLTGANRMLVAIIAIVGTSVFLGIAGELIGRRVQSSLHSGPLRVGDKVLGIAVGLLTAVLAMWFVGNLLATSRIATLDEGLHGSAVLGRINRVLPTLPSVFGRIEALLSANGLPVVFVNPPPGLVDPARLPDDQVTAATAQVARASVVKVVGQACGVIKSGSGFVAGPELVVTNAHVVAGESTTSVDDSSGSHRALVLGYDPRLDVAVLRVPGLSAPALPMREQTVARGTTAAIVGFPGGGAFRFSPAASNARIEAVGLDIYGQSVAVREVYELHGVVVPGDSGGPLVATGEESGTAGIARGTVIGVIFGNAPGDSNVGYALAMPAVTAEIDRARNAGAIATTGACLP